MSFARYAAIVKNLRGVVLGDIGDEGVWKSVQWLVKRFRYRDLGLTPSMVGRYRDKLAKYLGGNPFIELSPPIAAVERLIEILVQRSRIPAEVVELLVYSSTYISPAMVVGERFLDNVLQLALDTVYTCKEMDVNSWKLHLRIADYTVLDFYRNCVDEVLSALSSRGDRASVLRKIVEKRRARIESDKKRYWRIACSSGKPFLAYIDMLHLVLDTEGIAELLEPEHAACLAIVPVVYVPSNLS